MKRTVLVTGGSKGIGHATAELLLERGFRVILLARDEATLGAVRDGFVAAGHDSANIEIAAIDMADAEALERRVPQLLRLLQEGLFGLVNNAAYEVLKPLLTYSAAELEQTWKTNMLAPILMTRLCHPFLARAGGSIVNISSTADRDHYPGYSLYGGSKAFLNAFSCHAAKELGPAGIRVNVVSPGAIDTPLMQTFIDNGTFSPQEIADAKRAIPIEQRFGAAREVAETVLFALTGPRYLHGADLRMHGGAE